MYQNVTYRGVLLCVNIHTYTCITMFHIVQGVADLPDYTICDLYKCVSAVTLLCTKINKTLISPDALDCYIDMKYKIHHSPPQSSVW